MKGTIILLMCVCTIFAHALPVAWINEIHYENVGLDANEFVEVVVLHPENYYLDDMALYLVNGYNGLCYSMDTVQEFELGERIGDYQFYVWYKRGLQNGIDGMHLVFKDTTLDILAYEGSFVGNNDPFLNLTFPDICVCENSSSPDTCSVYHCGGRDSEWIYGIATPGYCNTGQCLTEASSDLILDQFRVKFIDQDPLILWSCSNENDMYAYNLYKNGKKIYTVNKASDKDQNHYFFHDHTQLKVDNSEYVLSQIHFCGDETFLDTLICSLPTRRDMGMGIPFPNPFNPIVTLPYTLENPGDIDISIFNLSGKQVYNYCKHISQNGPHIHQIDMNKNPSGEYIVQFKCNNTINRCKILLMK